MRYVHFLDEQKTNQKTHRLRVIQSHGNVGFRKKNLNSSQQQLGLKHKFFF